MNNNSIEKIANKVVDLRLSAVSIFLLEAHIPFTSIFHTANLALAPITYPILGSEKIHIISELFSERANIEVLIDIIEEKEKEFQKEQHEKKELL